MTTAAGISGQTDRFIDPSQQEQTKDTTKFASASQWTNDTVPAYKGVSEVSDATDASPTNYAEAQTDLASKLYPYLQPDDFGNKAVSPASTVSALYTFNLGGDAKFKQSSAQFAGVSGPADFRDLASGIKSDGPLQVANGIMFNQNLNLREGTEETLKASGVEFFHTLSTDQVNAWVNKNTNGKIPTLLDHPLSPDTTSVSLNALYFKDNWQNQFDPARTRSQDFHTGDGKTVAVNMMHGVPTLLPYRSDNDAHLAGVELPFEHERYALRLVTTTDDTTRLDASNGKVQEFLTGKDFTPTKVAVSIPKPTQPFTATNDITKPLLDNVHGSIDGFPQHGSLEIGGGIQKVVFTYDEKGAEAAAATGIETNRSVSFHKNFVADRPYAYALVDKETGAVIITGTVNRVP